MNLPRSAMEKQYLKYALIMFKRLQGKEAYDRLMGQFRSDSDSNKAQAKADLKSFIDSNEDKIENEIITAFSAVVAGGARG